MNWYNYPTYFLPFVFPPWTQLLCWWPISVLFPTLFPVHLFIVLRGICLVTSSFGKLIQTGMLGKQLSSTPDPRHCMLHDLCQATSPFQVSVF